MFVLFAVLLVRLVKVLLVSLTSWIDGGEGNVCFCGHEGTEAAEDKVKWQSDVALEEGREWSGCEGRDVALQRKREEFEKREGTSEQGFVASLLRL